jgi:DNA-binding GntR family transcriptional regulator
VTDRTASQAARGPLTPARSDNGDTGFERVSRQLRERILSGAFPQGGRLSEVRLAKEYGLSRGPIREALRRLEQERLVMSVPNRGTFVVRVTQIEVLEALELRSVLEPFAYSSSRNRRPDGLAASLIGVLNAFRARLAEDDFRALAGLHGQFHGVLYRESGNRTLMRMWGEMESVVELHVLSTLTSVEDGQRLLDRHAALAATLIEGDVEQGRAALVAHLAECAEHLDMPFLDAPAAVYAASHNGDAAAIERLGR